MYEALENWQFDNRMFWVSLDTFLAINRECDHEWNELNLDRIGKCYECRKCGLISKEAVDRKIPEKHKQLIRDSLFMQN
jgi:hypothetical protein